MLNWNVDCYHIKEGMCVCVWLIFFFHYSCHKNVLKCSPRIYLRSRLCIVNCVSQVGLDCRICWHHLCRGVRPQQRPQQIRHWSIRWRKLQPRIFGECGVSLQTVCKWLMLKLWLFYGNTWNHLNVPKKSSISFEHVIDRICL